MPSHAQTNVVGLSWATNAKSGWNIPVDGITDEENVIMVFPSASRAITTATITTESETKHMDARTQAGMHRPKRKRKKNSKHPLKGKYAHFQRGRDSEFPFGNDTRLMHSY